VVFKFEIQQVSWILQRSCPVECIFLFYVDVDIYIHCFFYSISPIFSKELLVLDADELICVDRDIDPVLVLGSL
jgi:hypothetical protein